VMFHWIWPGSFRGDGY